MKLLLKVLDSFELLIFHGLEVRGRVVVICEVDKVCVLLEVLDDVVVDGGNFVVDGHVDDDRSCKVE